MAINRTRAAPDVVLHVSVPLDYAMQAVSADHGGGGGGGDSSGSDSNGTPSKHKSQAVRGSDVTAALLGAGGGGANGGGGGGGAGPRNGQIASPTPSSWASGRPALSPAAVTGLIVLAWYSSNIGLIILNKYLLSELYYGFKYPIFLTLCHMVACSAYSYLATAGLRLVPPQRIASGRQLARVVALGAIFCFSVVAGNASLRYIPVSFSQAIGATSPAFTAAVAALVTFRLESLWTYLSLIPVVFGVVVASRAEPSFDALGTGLCLASTAARAFKTVLQGVLLSADAEKLQAMNLLLYMSPVAALLLLPAAALLEPGVFALAASKAAARPSFVLLLAANSTLAYLANLFNFLVTKHTGPLTLQVLGNAKGAAAVAVSVLIFRNPVSAAGMLGYGIAIAGVFAYSEARKRAAGVAVALPTAHVPPS